MLEIKWTTDDPSPAASQVLALPLRVEHQAKDIEARFGAAVAQAVEDGPCSGKPGETFAFTREQGKRLQHVVLFGIGDGLTSAAQLRTFAHDVARRAQSLMAKSLVVDLRWPGCGDLPDLDPNLFGSLFAEGLDLGTYAYDRYLSEHKRQPRTLHEVTMVASSTAAAEGTARGQIFAQSIARARDLANGPAELVTPSYLAQTAAEIVDGLRGSYDVELTVLERSECEARQMGCFLGVAKGSDEPPKFIHLTYRPHGKARGKVALIGKGVTFDSGGYSIKPSDGMLDMKLDMSGAAAVLGAFEGLARLNIPWEVHTIVAAAENMVSGHAYRLGDVLTASNGKTIEINNTDAEGRLTLADALVYASGLEPDFVIDVATLTGACVIALGPRIAGVMTRDDRLAEDWFAAAKRSGEAMWRLPLPEHLKEQLKSKIADMKNTGERGGGALTAGLFLSEFTGNTRWMHVDIAGPAMVSKAYDVTTAGGSGVPVATILELLSSDVLTA